MASEPQEKEARATRPGSLFLTTTMADAGGRKRPFDDAGPAPPPAKRAMPRWLKGEGRRSGLRAEGEGGRHRPIRSTSEEEEAAKTKRELAHAIVKSTTIGRGVFGTVVAPPPRCDDGSRLTRSRTAVGKISFKDEYSEREIAALEIMERIDPEHRYHVRYYGHCQPVWDPYSYTDHRLAEMIVMERAGPFSPRLYPPEALPEAVGRMWDGLKRMARAGLGYLDLHAGNILVGSDGFWRLIDYGSCESGLEPERALNMNADEYSHFLRKNFERHPQLDEWLRRIQSESASPSALASDS